MCVFGEKGKEHKDLATAFVLPSLPLNAPGITLPPSQRSWYYPPSLSTFLVLPTDIRLPERLLPRISLVEEVERESNVVHHLENTVGGYQLACARTWVEKQRLL